jgi:hypothetical protein
VCVFIDLVVNNLPMLARIRIRIRIRIRNAVRYFYFTPWIFRVGSDSGPVLKLLGPLPQTHLLYTVYKFRIKVSYLS